MLEELLLGEGSSIHRHNGLVWKNRLDSRNRVDIVHTYLLQRNQFSLGKCQLDMAAAVPSFGHRNAQLDTPIQSS